jgi:hypothetical protein
MLDQVWWPGRYWGDRHFPLFLSPSQVMLTDDIMKAVRHRIIH